MSSYDSCESMGAVRIELTFRRGKSPLQCHRLLHSRATFFSPAFSLILTHVICLCLTALCFSLVPLLGAVGFEPTLWPGKNRVQSEFCYAPSLFTTYYPRSRLHLSNILQAILDLVGRVAQTLEEWPDHLSEPRFFGPPTRIDQTSQFLTIHLPSSSAHPA